MIIGKKMARTISVPGIRDFNDKGQKDICNVKLHTEKV